MQGKHEHLRNLLTQIAIACVAVWVAFWLLSVWTPVKVDDRVVMTVGGLTFATVAGMVILKLSS